MALNLFYITNKPDVALIAERYGVDRIWVDLEILGKAERQGQVDSVKSHHTVEDVRIIKPLLTKSEMLVRVNPWHDGSVAEINAVIDAGADIVMLPMWKSIEEVKNFLETVGHRAKTSLLLETKEAVECVDEVLELDFDEVHIGLNDLHLSYHMTFMFEPLADGTVDALCAKFRERNIPYGFGGIAKIGDGLLPAEKLIMEHYRLGSTRAILSRTFCDNAVIDSTEEIERVFKENMAKIREFEDKVSHMTKQELLANQEDVKASVERIVEELKRKKS